MQEWLKHIPYWVVIIILGLLIFIPKDSKTVIQPNGVSSPIEVHSFGGCQTLEAIYGKKNT